jgi:hypothetical protein
MTAPKKTYAVVESGSLTCKDGGKRSLSGLSGTPSTIRLTVSSSPVVTVTEAGGSGTYTGCTATDSNGVNQPCGSTKVSSTGAGKLTAGGKAVLLDGDTVLSVNTAAPTGSGTDTVSAGQTKLTAT